MNKTLLIWWIFSVGSCFTLFFVMKIGVLLYTFFLIMFWIPYYVYLHNEVKDPKYYRGY